MILWYCYILGAHEAHEAAQATQEFTLSIPAKTTQAPQSTEPRSTRGPLTSRGNAVEPVELAGTRRDSHGFTNIIISNIFKYQIFIKYSNIPWTSWYKYDICICSIFIDHLLSLTNNRNLCFLLGLSRVLYACLWDIIDIIPVSKWFSAVLRPPPVTQPPSTAPRTTQAPEFLGAVGCGILED